jgi:hypothetical protein
MVDWGYVYKIPGFDVWRNLISLTILINRYGIIIGY